MHIEALVVEKLTDEQKYSDCKYVNTANHYTENEFNSFLLMIRSPQLKDKKSLFVSDMKYIYMI